MKRILVTGATGFIGSRLVQRLRDRGDDVYELRRPKSSDYQQDDPHLLWADLTDREGVRMAIRKAEPEVIAHLGALSPVTLSFQQPEMTFLTNLLGTVNVADGAAQVGARLVHASTAEVYGEGAKQRGGCIWPLEEGSHRCATSPYSVSKIAAEEYLLWAVNSKRLAATILRPFNTYGRASVGNWHFVVEKAIYQAITLCSISLGSPSPIRDFLWREDHVNGYLLAIDQPPPNGELRCLNLCTGYPCNIEALAQRVAALAEERFERTIPIEFMEPDRPSDIHALLGDNTRAQKELGWKPAVDLETGLSMAFDEWLRVLRPPF